MMIDRIEEQDGTAISVHAPPPGLVGGDLALGHCGDRIVAELPPEGRGSGGREPGEESSRAGGSREHGTYLVREVLGWGQVVTLCGADAGVAEELLEFVDGQVLGHHRPEGAMMSGRSPSTSVTT